MNVERLHAIVLALRADLRSALIVEALRTLATSLTNLSQQPSAAEYKEKTGSRTRVQTPKRPHSV